LLLLDGQVHHDTHLIPMGNYVIEVGNYVSVTRSNLGNYVSADSRWCQNWPASRRGGILRSIAAWPGPGLVQTHEARNSDQGQLAPPAALGCLVLGGSTLRAAVYNEILQVLASAGIESCLVNGTVNDARVLAQP
jgi:hypothetical protein